MTGHRPLPTLDVHLTIVKYILCDVGCVMYCHIQLLSAVTAMCVGPIKDHPRRCCSHVYQNQTPLLIAMFDRPWCPGAAISRHSSKTETKSLRKTHQNQLWGNNRNTYLRSARLSD